MLLLSYDGQLRRQCSVVWRSNDLIGVNSFAVFANIELENSIAPRAATLGRRRRRRNSATQQNKHRKMETPQSLIAELDDAIRSGSRDKRVDTLRRVTDLFVADADRLDNRQIHLFDDVLGHLIKRIEEKALVELSRRLGPITNAPTEVVRSLARHDNIAVVEPVLTQSARISDQDLMKSPAQDARASAGDFRAFPNWRRGYRRPSAARWHGGVSSPRRQFRRPVLR